MRKQQHIALTPTQRAAAQAVLDRGTAAALTHRHARILLEADAAVRRRVRRTWVRPRSLPRRRPKATRRSPQRATAGERR